MIIARKIAYNVVFSSVSKIISTILALIIIGFITRYLGKEGFGNYATVLAFLSFFSAIADLGLYSAVTREISRFKADEKMIMGNIFSLRVFISLFILILSPFFVIFFPYPEEVKKAIVIVAFSFVFSSSYQVLNGIFQKNLAMDRVAFSELTGKIIQVGFVFFAIKFNLGFLWIVGSLFFNMLVSFVLVYFLSKKYIRFKMRFDFVYWKKFLLDSYPIGLASIITFFYFKMDTILLSVLKSSAEVGIYNVAYKVVENITFFPAMIVGLVFPIMSQNVFLNKTRFNDICNKTFKFFWIMVVPLLVGGIFFSKDIISLIGGKGFSESVGTLKILIFALVFIFFGNFFNAILISSNQQKKMTKILFLAAVFNIISNLIFIPKYSYLAAALNSVLTEMFVVFGTYYIIKKEVKYFPKIDNLLMILFSGCLMAIYFYIFSEVNFLLLAISGSFLYFVFLWFFRVLNTEDITSIIKKN